MARLKFAGRKKEIEKFKKFICSEAKRVLLVIGKQGIGKTRFLEQLVLECYGFRDLECLVYTYQIKGTDPPEQYLYQMMDEIWSGKNVFARFGSKRKEIAKKSVAFIPFIGKIFRNITESIFRDQRRPVTDRFKMFLQKTIEGYKKENRRLVIFVDPLEDLRGQKHKEAWRVVTQHVPFKVKLIIAQRENDIIANCIELTEQENVECWSLDYLTEKETKHLLKSEFPYVNLPKEFIDEFASKNKGYPLLIDGAIKLLHKRKEFTIEALKKLPPARLTKLLYDKLENDERNLVNHLSVLEIPVDMRFLRNFTGIKGWTLDGLLRRINVKDVVKIVENAKNKYQIYHKSFKDFVIREMKKTDYNISSLDRKASKAFFKILEEDDRNRDALKYSTAHLLGVGDKRLYLDKVVQWFETKYRYGMIQVVFEELKNCLKISEEIEISRQYTAVLLNKLGITCRVKGVVDDSIKYHERALKIYRKASDRVSEANQLGNIGLAYYDKDDLDKALSYLKSSLKIHKEMGDLEGQAGGLSNIGMVYHTKGDFCNALSYYEQSLRIDEKLGRVEGQAMRLGNIGAVYSHEDNADRNLDKALHYCEKALDIDKKTGNADGEARHLGNIGVVYFHKHNLDKALSYYRKSLRIYRRLGMPREIAGNLFNIAAVYERKKNLELALRYYEESFSYYEKIGIKRYILDTKTAIDRVKKRMKDKNAR